jgi:hypothetical protein
MRRFRLMGFAVFVVLALSGTLAATASALPEVLPRTEIFKGVPDEEKPRLETTAGKESHVKAQTSTAIRKPIH